MGSDTAKGPAKLPEPAEKGAPIGFDVAYAKPNGRLALVGARVVTMRGGREETLDDGVVIVEGNRIAAVGRRGEVAIPAGAREIDLAGKDREAFDKSVGAVQGLVDACKKISPDLLGR